MEKKEKEKMFQQLNQKDLDLANARAELLLLQEQLNFTNQKIQDSLKGLPDPIIDYISDKVIRGIGGLPDVLGFTDRSIMRRFNRFREHLDTEFLEDMQEYNLINNEGELSLRGVKTIRRVATLKVGGH